ncbi:hypothetical protein B0T11DRAFT_307994 [Plectosphaerella cucumerina]|uniref:DUF1593-domain-containing protein n=1 Tax=Plectosphaerella cucumerina TaxID=40658 RepID=A0A8K0X013_9PEZI|nr:hypothetical protein B0T11DRAFT_307994 [Plectosphaerella cucumerina]
MTDQARLRRYGDKPRVVIATDIRNKPDDAESLVRYVLYSNVFNTRGLIAYTSVHIRQVVHPEDIETILTAYSTVIKNLNVHPDNPYTPAEEFFSLIKTGPTLYGKEALDPEVPLSDGAALIVERVDESEESLWVLCWGGPNSRSEADFARFRSKIRIRRRFPDIFYIYSVHGWKEYGNTAWFGISGDHLGDFDSGGPDKTKVTREWLRDNIQVGPLGAVYPTCPFLIEGDTPTFLYLIQNSLGGESRHFADARDMVTGKDGRLHHSNHATVWRWRDHFQDSFAARMRWTLSPDRSKANHAPVVSINGSSGPEALILEAEAGTEALTFDASETYDPDGDALTFHWFHYKEVSSAHEHPHWHVRDIEIRTVDGSDDRVVTVTLLPAEWSAVDRVSGRALLKGMQHHFVLQVTDNGSPPLTTYKRVVVQTTNKSLVGGRGRWFESVTESMGSLRQEDR